jgi:beta-lactamase regulating signal transducer with metallopeptidase domain
MMDALTSNLIPWMAQTTLLAAVGAVLPLLFRLRHPRTQIAYAHAVLAACLLLPLLQPWHHRVVIQEARSEESAVLTARTIPTPARADTPPQAAPQITPPQAPAPVPPVLWMQWIKAQTLLWILAAGAMARLVWLLVGLWQIRQYRIAAMPLYPIPESVRAASAITHADAVCCISTEIAGPVMLGWLAPVVLLPECFLSLEQEAQCAIACHEMLHVRRSDWIVTLLEEMAGALLWFNPAVWILLAQTRLAREQLVDAETVHLTSAREPYLEALLAIARSRQLDLAPAPLFLRRRHLTHRMHALLKEVSMSKTRLVASCGAISALLAGVAWFAFLSFPLTGQPQLIVAAVPPRMPPIAEPKFAPPPVAPSKTTVAVPSSPAEVPPSLVAFQAAPRRVLVAGTAGRLPSAPVPPDPQEPVAGGVQIASEPAARAAALSLLERARENGLNHRPGTPPYRLGAAFSASGSAVDVGSGQLTETWLSDQKWRWTAT